jgi:hypothetical protein
LDFFAAVLLISPRLFSLLFVPLLLFSPLPGQPLVLPELVSRKPEPEVEQVLPVLPLECYLHSFFRRFSRWHLGPNR